MLPRAEVAQLSWFQICMAKFDFQSIFMSRESLILLCIIAVEWVFFIINLAVGDGLCTNAGIRARTLFLPFFAIFWAFLLENNLWALLANSLMFLVLGWLAMRRGVNTFIALCMIVAVGSGAFVWTLGSTTTPYVGMSGTRSYTLFRNVMLSYLRFGLRCLGMIHIAIVGCTHEFCCFAFCTGLLFGLCTYLMVLGIVDESHRLSALFALLTMLVYAGVLLRAFSAKSSPWEAHIAGVIIGALTCVVEWKYFNLDFASAAGFSPGASASAAAPSGGKSETGNQAERAKLMDHDEDEADRIDPHGVK